MDNSRLNVRVVLYMDTIFSSILLVRVLLQVGQWIVSNTVTIGNNEDLKTFQFTDKSVWEPWMISIMMVYLVAKVMIPWNFLRVTEMSTDSARVLQAAKNYRMFTTVDFIVLLLVTPFILLAAQSYWSQIAASSWLVIGMSRIVCGLVVCSFIEDLKGAQLLPGPPSYAKVVEEQML